jgi:hypothetical protein
MKPSVVSSTPIPGWDCTLTQITDDQQAYVCSPSHKTIALVAYLEWTLSGSHPTTEAEAVRNWLVAEESVILSWEDGKI